MQNSVVLQPLHRHFNVSACPAATVIQFWTWFSSLCGLVSHSSKVPMSLERRETLQGCKGDILPLLDVSKLYHNLHAKSTKIIRFVGSLSGARCPAYNARDNLPSTRQNRLKNGKLNSPIRFDPTLKHWDCLIIFHPCLPSRK